MKITSVISEYNPFHNGHKYHLSEAKRITNADFLICIMSGNFVQRGEPSITHKWARTKMALLGGADMVIELPSFYSCQSAEFFAKAAVKLIIDTGITDFICFGSESGNIKSLYSIAKLIYSEPPEYKEIIKKYISQGISFPAARAYAIEKLCGLKQDNFKNSNDILAYEYLKALMHFKSSITPVTIKREDCGYNSLEINSMASASAIRNALKNKSYNNIFQTMPNEIYNIFNSLIKSGEAPIYFNDISHIINYKLRSMTKNDIIQIADITEGIENRILKSLDNCYNADDIVSFTKSKRYTFTKIQRILMHILLNIKKDDVQYFNLHGFSPYIRVLGFKKEKSMLLSQLQKNALIPVITNTKHANKILSSNSLEFFKKEVLTTNIYFQLMPNPAMRKLNCDFSHAMVII